MLYLAIETSSIRGSVGLFSESEWIRQLDLDEGLTCGDELLSRISTLLEDHRTTVSSLDGVAVSVGPGSYTGTRVGVTAAKTLSLACQLPAERSRGSQSVDECRSLRLEVIDLLNQAGYVFLIIRNLLLAVLEELQQLVLRLAVILVQDLVHPDGKFT